VVALVAWAVWSAVSPVSSKIEVALADISSTGATQSSGHVASNTIADGQVDWTGKPLMAVLITLGTAVTFYVAFEVIRFQRFCKSCDAIKRLGGRVVSSPACDNAFLRFVFSTTFVVDLSGTNVSDSNCPSFRAIPFLTKVQLGDTKIGRKTVEELSWCSHLVALDLSGTPLQRRQIGPLAKLKKLDNLLID
jgi:hypothetical protein